MQYGLSTATTMPCTANSNMLCGGRIINSLYEVVEPFYYIGCYVDGCERIPTQHQRTMQHQFPGVGYTPQTCFESAVSGGFQYFSMQYGGECWATNDLLSGEQYGPSNQCTMLCNDESLTGTQYPGHCGGALANAIWGTYGLPPVQPAATPTPPPGGKYQYQGCFIDGCTRTNQYRAMEKQFDGNSYDVDSCYEIAYSSGYSVFALQFGGECWASNSITAAERYGRSDNCNMFCYNEEIPFPGNCGGILTNAVYTILGEPVNPPVPSPNYQPTEAVTYESIGCFSDGSPRAMTQLVGLGSAMDVTYTIDTCGRRASALGYYYFALQWGGECWASSSLQFSERYGPSTKCNMPCRSDESEQCGGVLANNLYSINVPGGIPVESPLCPNSPYYLAANQLCSDGVTWCNGCMFCPDGNLCCNCQTLGS